MIKKWLASACKREGWANPFTWIWIIWFGVLVVAEAAALIVQGMNKGRQRTTLSQHWSTFAKKAPKLWFPLMIGFLGWLIWHWGFEPLQKLFG